MMIDILADCVSLQLLADSYTNIECRKFLFPDAGILKVVVVSCLREIRGFIFGQERSHQDFQERWLCLPLKMKGKERWTDE